MEEEIYAKAYQMGLNPRRTPKGFSIRCPKHEDRHNSAIVFKNDGWAACMASCGRWNFMGANYKPSEDNYKVRQEVKEDFIEADYYDFWLSLEPLSEGIKGIPARELNKLGWRKLPSNNPLRLPPGIFIPAFNPSRDKIPFCQVRHLEGDRRFSFPSRVKPLAFGMESIPKISKYVVFTEGNSDRAVLEMAGIPTIALPSGSSGKLLQSIGEWAKSEKFILVSASDRDTVGDLLLRSLDEVCTFIDARQVKYKDVGELFEAEGADGVRREYSWLRPNQSSS